MQICDKVSPYTMVSFSNKYYLPDSWEVYGPQRLSRFDSLSRLAPPPPHVDPEALFLATMLCFWTHCVVVCGTCLNALENKMHHDDATVLFVTLSTYL